MGNEKMGHVFRLIVSFLFWLEKKIEGKFFVVTFLWISRAHQSIASYQAITKFSKLSKLSQCSYDKMFIDWVWWWRKGKYLAFIHDARTSLRPVRTSWLQAKDFSVWPSHLVNKYIVLIMSPNFKCFPPHVKSLRLLYHDICVLAKTVFE